MGALPNLPGGRWLVLVGGGVDSAVILGLLASAGLEFELLHFDYGQKTRQRERACVEALCRRYRRTAPITARIPLLSELSGHDMLEAGAELGTAEPKRAYVPFRNTLFLAHAAAWAEHFGFDRIALGSHASDRICPDNTPQYIDAAQLLLRTAQLSSMPIHVEAPLLRMTKTEVVLAGQRIAVPFEQTWSCYNNAELACGTCGNCRDRLIAFAGAGLTDPIRYREGVCRSAS